VGILTTNPPGVFCRAWVGVGPHPPVSHIQEKK